MTLFADDVLFASYCVAGLQRQIDILKHFADNFSMTVNMNKAKKLLYAEKEVSLRPMWQ